MLEHGGRLRRASAVYGIALERWLDLSTGINPRPWAGVPTPLTLWHRLPEDEDGLAQTAQEYYGAPGVLPTAGSQAAILNLPRLRAPCRVGVLSPGYAEHAARWREAGHEVVPVTPAECPDAAATLDVLTLINPNNPTGHRFPRTQLLRWHGEITARGGWLIVDETFADTDPAESVAAETHREGLVVLKSLGKFFGLAGARVGFVLAAEPLREGLAERLGPWTIAGPSRAIAAGALNDRRWQNETRRRLRADATRLAALMRASGLAPSGGCELFQWVVTARASRIHERLARGGILCRLFDAPGSLRFGLPGTEEDWRRLETALPAAVDEASP